jgi:acetyl-CoA carboxylase carboxyltransferase component
MRSPHDWVGAARGAHVDAGRPEAVARQRGRGASTARERIGVLLDAGSFTEYGMLARPADETLDGPADGLVAGVGAIAGRPVVTLAYDYTVMGGSQGTVSHLKLDRMLRLAGDQGWPVAMLIEGGGARAQELDLPSAYTPSFAALARLSGRVPIVSAVLGPALAGHATLAGLSDVVVALRGATMAMAGPALVEARTGRRPRLEAPHRGTEELCSVASSPEHANPGSSWFAIETAERCRRKSASRRSVSITANT